MAYLLDLTGKSSEMVLSDFSVAMALVEWCSGLWTGVVFSNINALKKVFFKLLASIGTKKVDFMSFWILAEQVWRVSVDLFPNRLTHLGSLLYLHIASSELL